VTDKMNAINDSAVVMQPHDKIVTVQSMQERVDSGRAGRYEAVSMDGDVLVISV
jgi:hypothetical protein